MLTDVTGLSTLQRGLFLIARGEATDEAVAVAPAQTGPFRNPTVDGAPATDHPFCETGAR